MGARRIPGVVCCAPTVCRDAANHLPDPGVVAASVSQPQEFCSSVEQREDEAYAAFWLDAAWPRVAPLLAMPRARAVLADCRHGRLAAGEVFAAIDDMQLIRTLTPLPAEWVLILLVQIANRDDGHDAASDCLHRKADVLKRTKVEIAVSARIANVLACEEAKDDVLGEIIRLMRQPPSQAQFSASAAP